MIWHRQLLSEVTALWELIRLKLNRSVKRFAHNKKQFDALQLYFILNNKKHFIKKGTYFLLFTGSAVVGTQGPFHEINFTFNFAFTLSGFSISLGTGWETY